jgi:hypothetical protein
MSVLGFFFSAPRMITKQGVEYCEIIEHFEDNGMILEFMPAHKAIANT